MVYFTADWHFMHHNIIQYCERPFQRIEHMHDHIISRYNSIIHPNDTVYVLGDISIYGNARKSILYNLVNKMNGNKILILGNHDHLSPWDYIDIGFKSVHTNLKYKDYELVHDINKFHLWGYKVLCGHVHTGFKQMNKTINVGIDMWNYLPVSEEQIEEIYNEKN